MPSLQILDFIKDMPMRQLAFHTHRVTVYSGYIWLQSCNIDESLPSLSHYKASKEMYASCGQLLQVFRMIEIDGCCSTSS